MHPPVHRNRTARLLAAGLTAVSLVAGCQGNQARPDAHQDVTAPGPVGTNEAPVTTAPPVTITPTAVPTSASPKPKPKPPSYDVKAVQRQLTEQHYYVGAIDGERRNSLRSAVMAFQKVNGLHADGSVGKLTLAALRAPKTPKLRGSGGGTRVEVDLTKQVLYIAKGGVITRILPVSSGSGDHYRTKSGHLATALSPVGYYTITRRIVGERVADLGTLYDPQYFYRGWAIHGSNSVPAYPASHGCIRVTRTDAKWLLRTIDVGTHVYVYGGKHVFTAGSSAPGTDDPGGDTPDTTQPSPTPKPTTSPTTSPKPSPTASPTPSASPSILPKP